MWGKDHGGWPGEHLGERMANVSGYNALFNGPGGKRTRRDVVLWDVDEAGRGVGYVVADGKLVPAEVLPGFVAYDKDDPGPVVAALPGGGWWATFDPGPDGAPAMPQEVLCWTVDADGFVRAVVMDDAGFGFDPADGKSFAGFRRSRGSAPHPPTGAEPA